MNLIKSSLLGLVLVITGCASYPDAVQVPEGTSLVDFESVQANDEGFIGQKARWSGVIANIKNRANKTQIDVLYYPSKSTGRPHTKDEPLGRFRVLVDGFLEPEVYKKGKSITALGTIKEKESEKIDDYEYLYPTITDATLHLWKKAQPPARVEFYYAWPGYHPRYYWHGGVRHKYIIGGTNKKKPTGVIKSQDNKQ